MVAISKATLLENVWENFYDRVKDQVTSVTTDASDTFSVQTWTSSFPDSQIDDKSSYPIIVVNPVDISWEPFTFTKKYAEGTVTIDIYSTNSEACDMLLDATNQAIETFRDDLYALGLYWVDLDSTSSDSATRGGFKVHLRSVTYSFRFYFTKTFP